MGKLIKNNGLIIKNNKLNELYAENMTIQDLRFMAVYLANIDTNNDKKCEIWFKLADYLRYFNLQENYSIPYFKKICDEILNRQIVLSNTSDEYHPFNLFSDVCIKRNSVDGQWYIKIAVNPKKEVKDLVFRVSGNYFNYFKCRPENYIGLTSLAQIRMYEILKQYEKATFRELDIDELRRYLGIKETEHIRFENFKNCVLEPCKKALEDNTDIRFTYRKSKSGRGGKWLAIHFDIFKNTPKSVQLKFDSFDNVVPILPTTEYPNNTDNVIIEEQKQKERIEYTYNDNIIRDLAMFCDNAFNETNIMELATLIVMNPSIRPKNGDLQLGRGLYLQNAYARLQSEKQKQKIFDEFAYLKAIINDDIRKANRDLDG